MNDRTKQPVGMRISEKCVPVPRYLDCKVCRVAAGVTEVSSFIFYVIEQL